MMQRPSHSVQEQTRCDPMTGMAATASVPAYVA